MILTLLACNLGPELPEGWEDAAPVDDFHQEECGGSPYGDDTGGGGVDTGALALVAEADGTTAVSVSAGPIAARCSQDLTAYWQLGGSGAEVLIQPVDLHPSTVAKCDCTYAVSMSVPTPAPVTLDVWQRSDAYAGDPDLWQLGTVSAE